MNHLLRQRGGRRLCALVLSLGLFCIARGGPASGPTHLAFPAIELNGIQRGQSAIDALGAQLPAVARVYGMTAAELSRRLRADSTLALDEHGRLFYTDEAPLVANLSALDGIDGISDSAPAPADAFRLHSRPGAKRTIFLDFDGHVMSHNAWTDFYNGGLDIVAPPYDLDGNPDFFNDTERTRIIQIWQRVSEDYAPFDVDVTTQLSNESELTRSTLTDEYYGVRVLISPLSRYFGNYGGISYVGTFDDFGDAYKPSLVFCDVLGPNNEKYLAEAASHEAGHSLGLSHDGVVNGTGYYAGNGTGETGWAPIMGAGYYKNVTQWSRGEYSGANNTEDDLAVMQFHGIQYRDDDHGDTPATASYFPVGTELAASGVIERRDDADVFAFTTGAGPVTIAVSPESLGPNLDIRAELRDDRGRLLAVSNPVNLLSASFNLSLASGTYFLTVRAEGAGDPLTVGYSTYASLGQYSISGTVVNPDQTVPPVAVATAAPTSGTAPLPVTLDGRQSFDTDGRITGYVWNFGDGATATGARVAHTYVNPGIYTAVLTVTDDDSLTHSDSVSITVAAQNVAPVADATESSTSGTLPLAVTFDGSDSTDADGRVVAYSWSFGDGGSANGPIVQHTFLTEGTFLVTLWVTDDLGARGSTTISIAVSAVAAQVLRVESMGASTTSNSQGTIAWAAVRVTDPAGVPMAGVSVGGRWTGPMSSNRNKYTDEDGIALLSSKVVSVGGTMTCSVTRLSLGGYRYDPALNLQSTVSIVIPPP